MFIAFSRLTDTEVSAGFPPFDRLQCRGFPSDDESTRPDNDLFPAARINKCDVFNSDEALN